MCGRLCSATTGKTLAPTANCNLHLATCCFLHALAEVSSRFLSDGLRETSADLARSGSLSATLQMSLQSAETRPRECTETYFLASPFRMFSPLVALWPGPYRSRHTVTWGMVEGEEL